jgi:hypothetical protein
VGVTAATLPHACSTEQQMHNSTALHRSRGPYPAVLALCYAGVRHPLILLLQLLLVEV